MLDNPNLGHWMSDQFLRCQDARLPYKCAYLRTYLLGLCFHDLESRQRHSIPWRAVHAPKRLICGSLPYARLSRRFQLAK